MPYYPVFLDVETKPVLVIGGGTVGLEKVRGLIKAGAQVTVVSPQLEPTLASWQAEGKIQHLAREYAEGDMDGFVFVMAATDDGAVNAAVSAEGRRRGAQRPVEAGP